MGRPKGSKNKTRRKPKPVQAEAARPDSPAVADMRAERVPYSGYQSRLEVRNKDPNYFYYFHKDTGDNIQRALAAGYRFVSRRDAGRELPEELVNDRQGNRADDTLRVFGGQGDYGREYELVLMRLPMKLHLEDRKKREAVYDSIDSSIARRDLDGVAAKGQEYADINISVKTGEYADA